MYGTSCENCIAVSHVTMNYSLLLCRQRYHNADVKHVQKTLEKQGVQCNVMLCTPYAVKVTVLD